MAAKKKKKARGSKKASKKRVVRKAPKRARPVARKAKTGPKKSAATQLAEKRIRKSLGL